MAQLFKKPEVPASSDEDPQVAALRRSEQERAERDRIKATQSQLQTETRLRNSGSGIRSLFGSLFGRGGLRSLLGSG